MYFRIILVSFLSPAFWEPDSSGGRSVRAGRLPLSPPSSPLTSLHPPSPAGGVKLGGVLAGKGLARAVSRRMRAASGDSRAVNTPTLTHGRPPS